MTIRKTLLSILTLAASVAAGAQASDTLTVRIPGMRCDECAHKVMVALTENAQGIGDIDFDLERRTATIEYDPAQTSPKQIEDVLLATKRYKSKPYSPDEVIRRGIGIRLFEMKDSADAAKALAALANATGIDSLAPHIEKGYIFVRYDANKTKKAQIKATLTAAGFTPVNYYTSDNVKFGYYKAEAPTQDQLQNLVYIDGVEDYCYNPQQKTLGITIIANETTPDKLLSDINQAGIKIVPIDISSLSQ